VASRGGGGRLPSGLDAYRVAFWVIRRPCGVRENEMIFEMSDMG